MMRAARTRPLRAAALGLGLAVLAGCSGGSGRPANLLLVVFDTTRADHLGCFGHQRDTSPELDRLAERGVLLRQVYAQSTLTPVSAASFLTGTWPFRHGVRSLFVVGEQRLDPGVTSLAESLSRSGRRTAAFVSARPMGAHYGLDRGFGEYHDDLQATRERHGLARFADAPQRPADETAELCLDWLDRHGREPFGVLLHFFDAHDLSFLPPREHLAERVSFALPPDLGRLGNHPGLHQALRGRDDRLLELYDAEIRFMDLQLGRVLERLEELGVLEDTLVAVIADHGEAFGEHGFYTHGLLYEEQLRVPAILAGPGLPRGVEVERRLRLIDLAPTLAEALDLPLSAAKLDGASALSLIRGEAAGEGGLPREVFAEVHHADEDRLGREAEMYTLLLERWKYIHRPVSGAHELYDLEADPAELTNLYAPEHPMARALSARIAAWGAISGQVVDLEAMDPEELEMLRDLGYL